jgi:hypothetical protein
MLTEFLAYYRCLWLRRWPRLPEFAGLFRSTRQAFLDHERSKTELKALMPEDAKEATGHGVRAKRSKSGAISFDLLEVGGRSHAAQ